MVVQGLGKICESSDDHGDVIAKSVFAKGDDIFHFCTPIADANIGLAQWRMNCFEALPANPCLQRRRDLVNPRLA